MFVTKEEFKNLDIENVFNTGGNFIKITDGRHAIYHLEKGYKVIDYKKGIGLSEERKIPKYIKCKL